MSERVARDDPRAFTEYLADGQHCRVGCDYFAASPSPWSRSVTDEGAMLTL
jgi:hypothetical protein